MVIRTDSLQFPSTLKLTDINPKLTNSNFAKGWMLTRHYKDHGKEFGPITKEAYLRKACELFSSTPDGIDIFMQVRPRDGSLIFYKKSSNEFGVVTPAGIIKTFFRPDPKVHGKETNFDYYLQEISSY